MQRRRAPSDSDRLSRSETPVARSRRGSESEDPMETICTARGY